MHYLVHNMLRSPSCLVRPSLIPRPSPLLRFLVYFASKTGARKSLGMRLGQTTLVMNLNNQLYGRYLVLERRRGRALDPVAHFHLLNGAFIWRLNWLADTSPNGLQRSHGLMVNYRYHLPDIGRNSDAYRTDTNQMINYSSDVEKYL